MIAIIDYGIGNLGSVVKAFKYLEIPVTLTSDENEIRSAEAVVLPGVGAFGEGMNNLQERNLKQVIFDDVADGKPFLGICLGLQLLFSSSEEDHDIPGLDLIDGKVTKFDIKQVDKIPHMGWNQVELKQDDPVFEGFSRPHNLYFVHSYYVDPVDEDVILGKTKYGSEDFVSVIRKGNVWGIQCHPEKSSKVGLKVLKNFNEVVSNGSNSGN